MLKRKCRKNLFLLSIVLISLISILLIFSKEKTVLRVIELYSISDTVFENTKNDREWVINDNVIQYSSLFLINKRNKSITAESLVFLNYDIVNVTELQFHLKCAIRAGYFMFLTEVDNLIRITLMDSSKHLYKTMCKFEYYQEEDFSDLSFAVVNKDEYLFGLDQEYNGRRFPLRYIQFQKPAIMYKRLAKLPVVAHCLHMAKLVSEHHDKIKKLLNWIEIQKTIGVNEITIYNVSLSNVLDGKFDSNYIKIVQFPINFEAVCNTQIQYFNKNPNETISTEMYRKCKNIHEHYFTINELERLNTNDCYMHYRNKYKFVTNYDFDELILPRLPTMQKQKSLLKCDKAYEKEFTYNINTFANELFNNFLMNGAACLLFDHFLLIYDDERVYEFLKNLRDNLNNETEQIAELEWSKNLTIKFVMNKHTNLYVKHLKSYYQQFECLKNKYMNNSNINVHLNNAVGSLVSVRYGKSIFNTDYTITINQHYTDKAIAHTHCKGVPSAVGYTSHFRDYIHSFYLNQNYSITNFQIDLAYYTFIIKHFSKEKID